MAGRPSKLTPQVHNRIIEAIKQGATYDLASKYGGIAYNTFNEWMKRGAQEDEGPFRDFYDAVKLAEGQAAMHWLSLIQMAAHGGNWQAAAWKLERRYPNEYGRRLVQVDSKTEITFNPDSVIAAFQAAAQLDALEDDE